MKTLKANTARTIGSTDPDNAPNPEATDQKGDLLICDIWQNGTDSVHDIFVVDTDAKFHSGKPPEKCLQEAEKVKKRMYLEACLQQRRRFSPFVASMDGLLGMEAMDTLKRIASCLTTKCRQTYLRMCGYTKISIVITLVQATHRCIRGIQGAVALYQCAAPSVGRRRRNKPIQVSVPGGMQTPSNYPLPPLYNIPNLPTPKPRQVKPAQGY